MGFEILDEQIEWEARRVAAAFGVEELRFEGYHEPTQTFGESASYRGSLEEYTVACWIVKETRQVGKLAVGIPGKQVCIICRRLKELATD